MNERNLKVLVAGICSAIAFICISICAINFKNTSILWWYLIPAHIVGESTGY